MTWFLGCADDGQQLCWTCEAVALLLFQDPFKSLNFVSQWLYDSVLLVQVWCSTPMQKMHLPQLNPNIQSVYGFLFCTGINAYGLASIELNMLSTKLRG